MRQWISVKDRLPTEYGDYICTLQDYYEPFIIILTFDPDPGVGKYKWWHELYNVSQDEVKAWIPLPEPYEQPTVKQPPCETCKHRCREWKNYSEVENDIQK